MTSFATPQNLADRLGHTLDVARAQIILDAVSNSMRSYARQTFDEVLGDVVRIRIINDTIVLPQRPVINVNSVSRVNPDNTVTSIPGWIFDGIDKIYGSNRLTWVINIPAVWTDYPYPTTAEVNYDHGYAVLPGDLEDVCLAVAGRAYETPAAGAMQSEKIGEYTYRVNESLGSPTSLLADEKEVLEKYRRSSRSVPLRAPLQW